MGLFFRKKQLNKRHFNNSDFAYALFMSLGVGYIDPLYRQAVQEINAAAKTRLEVILKIISLIPDPKTPKELYTVAYAYVYAGAKYRKEAIEYLHRYIECGGVYQSTCFVEDSEFKISFDQATGLMADNYTWLGKAYEGEEQFSEAFKCYRKALELVPFYLENYIRIAKLYTKTNDILSGLNYLNEIILDCPYYRLSSASGTGSFQRGIDLCVDELETMQRIGYYYETKKERAEKKQKDAETLAWIAEHLPDLCPKSVTSFRRMRTQKSTGYQRIVCAAKNLGFDIDEQNPYKKQTPKYVDELLIDAIAFAKAHPDVYVHDISKEFSISGFRANIIYNELVRQGYATFPSKRE